MEQIKIPAGYHSDLNLHDTQVAIKTVKDFFQQTLSQKLNLLRVSAPVFVLGCILDCVITLSVGDDVNWVFCRYNSRQSATSFSGEIKVSISSRARLSPTWGMWAKTLTVFSFVRNLWFRVVAKRWVSSRTRCNNRRASLRFGSRNGVLLPGRYISSSRFANPATGMSKFKAVKTD